MKFSSLKPRFTLVIALLTLMNVGAAVTVEESLSFEVSKFPVDHQGPQVIDLIVELTYAPGIGAQEYPDFEAIRARLITWMEAYPNETDYWEVFNQQLGRFVLTTWPMVDRVRLDIVVYPTFSIQYPHTSTCTLTR